MKTLILFLKAMVIIRPKKIKNYNISKHPTSCIQNFPI
jgi:hypothetical protein